MPTPCRKLRLVINIAMDKIKGLVSKLRSKENRKVVVIVVAGALALGGVTVNPEIIDAVLSVASLFAQ